MRSSIDVPRAPAAPEVVDDTVWRIVGAPLLPGAPGGPLHGRGVAVKDLYSVRGHAVGAGNPTWLAGAAPEESSAPVVEALLSAGAHVVGIARTDEFAYSLAGENVHYGTPPNPAAPDRVPGGSTSGPATAVSLGEADIALGTDTAGSIRVPASYQGLHGLRTTHGVLDRSGLLPLAPSFDAVGWLTRDADLLAAVAAALLPDPDGPIARLLLAEDLFGHLDAELQETAQAGGEDLAIRVGLRLERTQLASAAEHESWFAAFRVVQAHEAWQAHGPWLTAHPDALGPDVAGRFRTAAGIPVAAARDARLVVEAARTALLRRLPARSAVLLPAASGPAPRRQASRAAVESARGRTLRLTCLAGLGGLPALALPAVTTPDGAPVGLCLLSAPGGDRALTDLVARAAAPGARGGRGADGESCDQRD